MIDTKIVDVNLLEAEFYNKEFNFSYSSLNKLITAPAAFYKDYILKDREIEHAKYLLEGIIIHYLVLEQQGFDDKFIVSSEDLPSPNSMAIADTMFEIYKDKDDETLELCDFETEILDQLKEMNLHQSLKDTSAGTGDAKRIAKIVEPRAEAYFTFLKQKGNRTIIDSALLDQCTRRADIVKANPQMRELLGLDIDSDGKTFGVYNELPIKVEAEKEMPFGYKGVIDNIVVDVNNRIVRINDFKTTGKSLIHFEDSVEFWNYWLQAAIYVNLVKSFLSKVITKDWVIEFRFIVFDKYDQLYAFPVTGKTLNEWSKKFNLIEKEALYHYTSKDYTLPYSFAQGSVNL